MTPFESLSHEKLTKEKEIKLAEKIQKGSKRQSEAAVKALVLKSLREAVEYSRHLYHGLLEDSELMSVCYSALLANARRFNPRRGRFLQFCKARLRGAIKRNWQVRDVVKNASMKRRQENQDMTLPTFMHWETFLQNGFSDRPEIDEDFTPEPLGVAEPDWQGIQAREQSAKIWNAIRRILKNDRAELILFCRYDQGLDFTDIAALLDMSRAGVQLAHKRSMQKLQAELAHLRELISE